jgi:NADH:ubiquinone oxidoreductase subunit F (NADH-binding)
MARNVVEFFRNESCGKCVPCRIGTQKAVEMLQAAQAEPSKRVNLSVLTDLHETLSLTSICGLGQVALTPIMSVTKHFGEHVSNVVEQS